ncbi:MAG TPA: DUF2971 domain-containing protein [Accumulibacter sp.]|nr:DUF2971 domain-containing protein [Accumulibacter sp.]
MSKPEHEQRIPVPLGLIEPHAPVLRTPPEDQLLYKVMTVENLLRSVSGNYLHFNRVDSYCDFPSADPNDGRQLPMDHPANVASRFAKAHDYSAADYYDQSRGRTYACCLSIENSDFIWRNYANGGEKGKVCVVFEFGKLRAILNQTLARGSAVLLYEGNRCHQIFSINYGLVDYVKWDEYQTNERHLSNPILYSYLKDAVGYSDEKELRISLSAIGIGKFALNDGSIMQFEPSLQVAFDFRTAIATTAIQEVLLAPGSDAGLLTRELAKIRIEPAQEPAT